MASSRQQTLRQLEARLLALRPLNGHAAAVDANLAIVRAMRSPISFARWLATKPRYPREALLEVNELLEEWDGPIHQLLLQMERRHSPGLIRPLVQRLVQLARGQDRFTLVDIGAGAMEVERQVILQLRCISPGTRLRMVALEPSATARGFARKNLAGVGVSVQEIDASELPQALASADDAAGHHVWLCRGSSADLPPGLGRFADVAFHCFVRHHLGPDECAALDQTCGSIARRWIEYDGYRHWAHPAFMSVFCWHEPAFLAAGVFSYLRYPHVPEVLQRGRKVRRFANGSYLAETQGG